MRPAGSAVALVTPETDRHGGKTLHAAQFTGFIDISEAAIIPAYLYRHTETQTLYFTAIDRQYRTPGSEAGHDISAADNGGKT